MGIKKTVKKGLKGGKKGLAGKDIFRKIGAKKNKALKNKR